MDTFWIRTVSQAGVYITFAAYLLWALRRGPREWVPLVGAAIYAVIFEHFNMLRYAHSQGGYHYHPRSWIWVWGDVPLYIPLAWGFILATSRSLTDHLHLRAWARPFCDALLALLIDISMDVVAIRLKFWFWHGVGINEGFFGVPADNFVGWLLVSFTFSALTRLLWDRKLDQRMAVPVRIGIQLLIMPAAYGLYLVLEAMVHVQYHVFHADSLRGQLNVLAGFLALFLLITLAGTRNPGAGAEARSDADAKHLERLRIHGPRHIFHLFGLIGLLFVPAAVRFPALWLLAGAVWTTEILIALLAHHRVRRVAASPKNQGGKSAS